MVPQDFAPSLLLKISENRISMSPLPPPLYYSFLMMKLRSCHCFCVFNNSSNEPTLLNNC